MSIFDDIVSNKELPDDFKIAVGDKGEMTLGELRGINSRLAETQTRAESAAAERDRYRSEYEKMNGSVASLLAEAGRTADANDRQPPADPKQAAREALAALLEKDDPTNALFEDKLFGKALSTVEERAVKRALEEIGRVNGDVKALTELVNNGFQGLTRAQLLEREQRWYDVNRNDIPKAQDGKRASLSDIRKYAQDRNMVIPGTQLLDFDRALESLTEPARVEARMSEAEKRGYEKGLQAARASAGKVLPIFGDRSAGGLPKPAVDTKGKSARQIMEGSIAAGLSELAAEAERG